jgi:rhomboid protease GluP
MFGRKKEGSVVCPSCGLLVGVNDDKCLNCGRRNPGLWGFAPALAGLTRGDLGDAFLNFIVVVCGVLYVASLIVGGVEMGGFMNFLSPGIEGWFLFGASGAIPVFELGRWWTVFSATWLHGSLLHILFNMYMVRQMAPAVIEFYGLSRMIIIYVLSGVVGFAVSSFVGEFLALPGFLRGAEFTLGASASLLGLIGAILHYSHRTGSTMISQQIRMWLIYLLVWGILFPGIDNWAHLGGLGGGYLVGMWLDPLHPERGNHTLIALGLLGMSALSIVFSVVNGLQFI